MVCRLRPGLRFQVRSRSALGLGRPGTPGRAGDVLGLLKTVQVMLGHSTIVTTADI
jgi:hypothetical protein